MRRFGGTLVGTLNINGATEAFFTRLGECAQTMKETRTIALAIQEHHRVFEGPMKTYTTAHRVVAYLTSAEKVGDSVVGGNGILLHPMIADLNPVVQAVTPRITTVAYEITRQRWTTRYLIINIYAPHAASAAGAREEFFEKLQQTLRAVPEHTRVLILGDWNSIQRPDEKHPFGFNRPLSDQREAASSQFHEFLDMNDLVNVSGFFPLPQHHTYVAPHRGANRRVPLDHIVVQESMRRFVCGVGAFTAPVPTDHRLLMAAFDKRFLDRPEREPPPPKREARPDCTPLYDPTQVEARNRFVQKVREALPAAINVDSYPALVEAYTKAAKATLQPLKPPRMRATVTHDTVVEARASYTATQSEDLHTLKIAFQAIVRATATIREEDVKNFLNLFETHVNKNPATAYHAIGQLAFKDSTARGRVAGATVLERKNAIRAACAAQLQNDVGNEAAINWPPIPGAEHCVYNEGPITLNEVKEAVKFLKLRKAAGLDQVHNEYLRLEEFHVELCQLFNDMFDKGVTPESMRKTCFAMIPKPNSSPKCPKTGWRYIALMQCTAKLYNVVLRQRLRPHVEKLMMDFQNGFRPKRGTLQHVVALQRIMEEIKNSMDLTFIGSFVDFKNAFPSVRWFAIEKALRAYRVPEKLIKAIMSVYHGHKGVVLTPEGPTDPFDITAGVLQGDTLAPLLFVIVLDCVLRQILKEEGGIEIIPGRAQTRVLRNSVPAQRAQILGFADDLVGFATTVAEANAFLNRLKVEAEKVGLVINAKKTQVLTLGDIGENPIFKVGDNQLEVVDSYKYLGRETDVDKDMRMRTGRAFSALGKYSRVWQSDLKIELKVRLWQTCVQPILLYGWGTYPLTVQRQNQMCGITTRMLRRVHNLKWNQHQTVENLYLMGKVPQATETVAKLTLGIIQRTMTNAAPRYGDTPPQHRQPLQLVLGYEPKTRRRHGNVVTLRSTILAHGGGRTMPEIVATLKDKTQAKYLITNAMMVAADKREAVIEKGREIHHAEKVLDFHIKALEKFLYNDKVVLTRSIWHRLLQHSGFGIRVALLASIDIPFPLPEVVLQQPVVQRTLAAVRTATADMNLFARNYGAPQRERLEVVQAKSLVEKLMLFRKLEWEEYLLPKTVLDSIAFTTGVEFPRPKHPNQAKAFYRLHIASFPEAPQNRHREHACSPEDVQQPAAAAAAAAAAAPAAPPATDSSSSASESETLAMREARRQRNSPEPLRPQKPCGPRPERGRKQPYRGAQAAAAAAQAAVQPRAPDTPPPARPQRAAKTAAIAGFARLPGARTQARQQATSSEDTSSGEDEDDRFAPPYRHGGGTQPPAAAAAAAATPQHRGTKTNRHLAVRNDRTPGDQKSPSPARARRDARAAWRISPHADESDSHPAFTAAAIAAAAQPPPQSQWGAPQPGARELSASDFA